MRLSYSELFVKISKFFRVPCVFGATIEGESEATGIYQDLWHKKTSLQS